MHTFLGFNYAHPQWTLIQNLMGDNSHISCSNEQCKSFLPIYTWGPFQWCVTFPISSSLTHTFPIFNFCLESIMCFKISMGDNSHLLFKSKIWRLLTHSHVKKILMICYNFHLKFISKVKQIIFGHSKWLRKQIIFTNDIPWQILWTLNHKTCTHTQKS